MPDYRVLAFSDTHSPLTCPKKWAWLTQHIRDFQPDVIVHLGDWLEGKRGSRHARDERHNWHVLEEFRSLAKQANEINELAPDAYKVWIYGNHDANLLEYVPDHLTKEDSVAFRELFDTIAGDSLKGWHILDTYRHETNWYLGQLCFRHGSDVSKAAVAKDIADYCPYNGLMVSGHTHRPERITQHNAGGVLYPFYHANTGTLCKHDQMHYMDRQRKSSWGAGVLLAEVTAPGLKEGRKNYDKPRWKARIEVFGITSRNYHDVELTG